jgi:hypothetical protein
MANWLALAIRTCSQIAVLKGVSEGDRVINGNLQKIGPGALVQPLLQ